MRSETYIIDQEGTAHLSPGRPPPEKTKSRENKKKCPEQKEKPSDTMGGVRGKTRNRVGTGESGFRKEVKEGQVGG